MWSYSLVQNWQRFHLNWTGSMLHTHTHTHAHTHTHTHGELYFLQTYKTTSCDHRSWWTTAFRSPVLTLGGTAFCQPSTACSTTLPAQQFRPSGLTSCQPRSGTLSQIHLGPDNQCRLLEMFTLLKCVCSLDTSIFSKLQVLENNCTIQIFLLTYLQAQISSWLKLTKQNTEILATDIHKRSSVSVNVTSTSLHHVTKHCLCKKHLHQSYNHK